MELVALLRTLWRFRIAVVVGAVLAVALGLVAMRGETTRTGVASMRVVLDTPKSQTVDVLPDGADTLEWRAGLLADVMGADSARDDIAKRMGVDADSLVVTAPYLSVPDLPVALPRAALDVAAVVPQPYEVAIQARTLLPIIGIDARAPSRDEAARLATRAVEALGARAASDTGPVQKLVIEPVGPVRAKEIVNGPRRMIAVIAAALLFGAWCTCIALADGLSRRRRQAFACRTAIITRP